MADLYSEAIVDKKIADAYKKAITHQNNGEYEDAIKILHSVIVVDPSFVEAHNSLGLTYKKMGDYDSAEKYYNLGIETLFQNIYDQSQGKIIKKPSERYTLIKSNIWKDVATQVMVKNSSRDHVGTLRFPDGHSAVKLSKQYSSESPIFIDENNIRQVLPAYFSVVYETLKSNLLYSILLNNSATALAEFGDKPQAIKLYKESLEFVPDGIEYEGPIINLRELESTENEVANTNDYVTNLSENPKPDLTNTKKRGWFSKKEKGASNMNNKFGVIFKKFFSGGTAQVEKESAPIIEYSNNKLTPTDASNLLISGKATIAINKGRLYDRLSQKYPQLTKDELKNIIAYITFGVVNQESLAMTELGYGLGSSGTAEDEIPTGYGEFGRCLTNPIPVNGLLANDLYLDRLTTENNERLVWERVGSDKSVLPEILGSVDIYEIKTERGERLGSLFISPYNQKLSHKAPRGLHFR